MSRENARLFFEKIEKDAELKMLFAKRLLSHQIETRKAFSDMIVGLGKEVGFEFTAADLTKNVANETGALSDAELESVAGGSISDMTYKDLIKMQQATSDFSNLLSMTSALQKTLSEMVKSITNNLRIF